MSITAYFASLSLLKLVKNLPGGVAQGLIWGLMALGVYITFRLLDVADLTVDGSFTTGGAVTVMLILAGVPAWAALLVAVVAGMLAGLCTGLLHTKLGIPAILAGILTQFSLYSINLRIMGMAANKAVSVDKFSLVLSSRSISSAILTGALIALALVALFYWYFGTEQGSALRATGSNPNMSAAQGINVNRMKVLGLSLSNGIVALSGGRQHGPRCDRHRPCRRHNRRGYCPRDTWQASEFLRYADLYGHRRRDILRGRRYRPLAAAEFQRPEAVHGDNRRGIPRSAIPPRKAAEFLRETEKKGG